MQRPSTISVSKMPFVSWSNVSSIKFMVSSGDATGGGFEFHPCERDLHGRRIELGNSFMLVVKAIMDRFVFAHADCRRFVEVPVVLRKRLVDSLCSNLSVLTASIAAMLTGGCGASQVTSRSIATQAAMLSWARLDDQLVLSVVGLVQLRFCADTNFAGSDCQNHSLRSISPCFSNRERQNAECRMHRKGRTW